nr:reverse transcriptase domain-containing protein [Tanacetum cinerariifolium]
MPSHIKTYDGSEDPKDHFEIFQAAAKTKCWAMPTWCHMFNSPITENERVWFDDLPKESIDSYDDLKEAFLENYLQQKKYIKDPVEIHNIKQRDRESTEEFVWRYKLECRDVKKSVASNQRIKAMQWKRPGESGKKKRETSRKDKVAMLMVQPWQRIAKQKITQTLSPESVISFPPLRGEDGMEDPMIIKSEMGGHFVHRMYVDGGSSLEILYEHRFNGFCPERLADINRVSRHITEHKLGIRKGFLPARQKKRGQAPERNKAICEEVEKLVDADIMKEVNYHSWMSNPVMVKKHEAAGGCAWISRT